MAKATADIRSLARAQTALAIRTLTGVCGSKAAPAAARVSAAQALSRLKLLSRCQNTFAKSSG
jgi:hypothetical protein